jgi:serine/threonine protein kinase
MLGAAFGDRYTLERRLGSGGMASVWLALDEVLARPVAVKVMADTLALDEEYRARFSREARAAASVSHPNIVPVYDYGLHGGRPFLVMEYVTGGSLADVFAGRRSAVPAPADLAIELLGALECVHGAGLIHRDVKPANILLDANGHARLTDFGIAQPEDATSLTQTGMVLGSVRYLAPEVAAGARASAAADLYGAGVVLRELTDRHPAPGLSALIAALTATDPERRPSSAAAARLVVAGVSGEYVDPTAATLIAPVAPPPRATPGSSSQTTTRQPRSGAGPDRGRGSPRFDVPRRALAAAGMILLLFVAVVVLNAARTSGSASVKTVTTTVFDPAAAGAPLTSQLSSLRQIVNAAAKP